MDIENNTPFTAEWIPCTNQEGAEILLVLCKCTFDIDQGGRLEVTQKQRPLQMTDTWRGDPSETSTIWESDAAFAKAGCDFVLVASAIAPSGNAQQVDVTLRVGDRSGTIRVFGDRIWESGRLGARISPPETFEKIPLIYERAYGGISPASDGKDRFMQNPVGTGYCTDAKQLDGVALPNLELTSSLIKNWSDRPRAAGFGFFGRNWTPRSQLAGTYDDQWRSRRMPALPEDFRLRYMNGSHPDWFFETAPEEQRVEITNVSINSPVQLTIPKLDMVAYAEIGKQLQQAKPELDTIVVDTDCSQLVLVFRARFPCHRQLLDVKGVRLDLCRSANQVA